jgi:hypothetical protein
MTGIWAWTFEVPFDLLLKLVQCCRSDVELPLQVTTRLALHLVNLTECEHALADNRPRLVRVGVITHHLGGEHERGDKQAVA